MEYPCDIQNETYIYLPVVVIDVPSFNKLASKLSVVECVEVLEVTVLAKSKIEETFVVTAVEVEVVPMVVQG